MRRLPWVLIIALAFSAVATAADIAFYIGQWNTDGWYSEQQFTDVETIITQTGHLFRDIQQFDDDQFDAFGAWVDENTADGEMDIIWLNGCLPSVLYPYPNLETDGSRIEEWLDGGNMVINVGDWFAYVSYETGSREPTNSEAGAANILDLSSGIIQNAGGTQVTVTAEGQEYLPSLGSGDITTDRPVALGAIDAPWEVAAAFASNGTQADPVVIRNTETGGYLAIINQAAGGPGGWIDDRGLTCAEFIGNWVNNVVGLANPALASDPIPEDEAIDVLRDVVLGWVSGDYAVTHDVYFGTVFDDVNTASRTDPMGVLVSQGQSDATYDPDGLLDFGVTYYWRIDEVNGAPDNTIFKGETWSFTAEPMGYPIEGVIATTTGIPQAGAVLENTVNGAGLNELDQHSIVSSDMWVGVADGDIPLQFQYEFDRVYKMHEMLVWNYNVQFEVILGFGLKDVTVEYSIDGVEWAVLGDVEFAKATSNADYAANTTVAFDGVAAKYVRLTVNSGHGMMGQFGLSEVRFLYIPAHAREPEPADGATDVSVNTPLVWRAGRDSISHDVYVGADPAALTLDGTVDVASYMPDALDLDATIYWRVDEIQETESWEGNVWSFVTQPYIVVDDFESYDDEDNRIYQTWIDGYGVPSNGSTVGNLESPFAEQTIVKGGKQSMPLFYDNAGTTMAEAELTLAGQDWAASGIKSLTLWFRGDTDNTGGQLYVKINGTKIPYDGDTGGLGIGGWQKWSIVLAETGASLSNVTKLIVGVEGAGAQGVVFVDDIRLSPEVSTPHTSDIGIAISGQANWWSQGAADRENEEIVDNAQAPVIVFNASDQDGLADWLSDHTNNGVANLLILCGQLPDTIYEPGNVQADDSIVEQFLDAGNTIINTGDWIFYVVNGAGTNAAAGLQTIMDIPGVTVAGEDNTDVTVTAEGQELTPSLQDLATDRPFHLDTLEGDWSPELILAQNADGTRADPVIVRNSATGGRIGIFYQTNGQDDDPRGEVMSEWINNWYLDAAGGN